MERVAQYADNLFADFAPCNHRKGIGNSLEENLWHCSSNMSDKVDSLEECVAHFNTRAT